MSVRLARSALALRRVSPALALARLPASARSASASASASRAFAGAAHASHHADAHADAHVDAHHDHHEEPDLRVRHPQIPIPDKPLPEDFELLYMDAVHPEPVLDLVDDRVSPAWALGQLCIAFGALFGMYKTVELVYNLNFKHGNPAAPRHLSLTHGVTIGCKPTEATAASAGAGAEEAEEEDE